MTQFTSRPQQAQSEEIPEYAVTGPFGGIQSELPLDQIEELGFFDVTNFMFRKGTATIRPGFATLPPFSTPSNERICGIYDFFDRNAFRDQIVLTPTRLLLWVPGAPGSWGAVPGPAFGTSLNPIFFSFTVVGNKLCFSQGIDKIWVWDGITNSYSQSSVNAPAAFYLAEIGLHLMALNTTEGGQRFTQRYHWSGIGDPTDWTSFSSGTNDESSDLGPGNGLLKLGQYGFGWHQRGIVQIQPTGIGTAPFYMTPLSSTNVGTICPQSLAKFNQDGVECAVYIGKDNVYIFNQSSVIPIGDAPIDGRRRLGARSRIFTDLLAGDLAQVFGYVTQCIGGHIYNAYWIIIPNVCVWVYNFDESNWTRFIFNGTQTVAGLFFGQNPLTIGSLVGPIAAQNWTPATLLGTKQFDDFAIGYNNGQIADFDMSVNSELPATIMSGSCLFRDRRHSKTVKKFRISVIDNGPVAYTLTVTSSTGYSETKTVTLGNGGGNPLTYIFTFNVQGLRVQWTLSVPPLQYASITEFAPMAVVGGEQRGGTQDQ